MRLGTMLAIPPNGFVKYYGWSLFADTDANESDVFIVITQHPLDVYTLRNIRTNKTFTTQYAARLKPVTSLYRRS